MDICGDQVDEVCVWPFKQEYTESVTQLSIYVIYWFLPFLFINSKLVLHQDWFYRYDEDAQKLLSTSLYLSFSLSTYTYIFSAKPPSLPPYFVWEGTQWGSWQPASCRSWYPVCRVNNPLSRCWHFVSCHKSKYSQNAFILFLLSWEQECVWIILQLLQVTAIFRC